MNSLAVSSKRVQRFEGKLNICKGKQLSVPERVGVYVISREKTNKLKIAGDNVNFGLCDSRDYFASALLLIQNKFGLTMTFLSKKTVN